MNKLKNELVKRRRLWAVICEKRNTCGINRTEYQSGLCQKIWPAAHFFHIFFLEPGCISFEVSHSVYQFIGDKKDSNSNTEWSQPYNLYQTAIITVSNNKPFVLTHKSHNTISIPKQFITNMYSRGNASFKAYRFWRLKPLALCRQQVFPAQRNSSSTGAPADAWEPIPFAEQNDGVAGTTLVTTVCNDFERWLPGVRALRMLRVVLVGFCGF